MDVEALRAHCAELEDANDRLTRVNEALMNRVEREMDVQGSTFALFQSAIALEAKVKERTAALNDALKRLEQTNHELTVSNEAALEASRAKSAFLAAMSHELRTPMNGVVGMTELLLTTPLSAQQRDSTEVIQRSALSLLLILNDILDFSKIEAGHMEMERTPFVLRTATEQALKLLCPQVKQKGLHLALDWSPEVPHTVLGDPTRYSQILTNLVANAAKFTATGEVRVSVRSERLPDGSTRIRCDVVDTGIGIATEVLPRLFQPFSQADSSTTRQFGGTGLGLAIVRRLCQLMGGECGVESTVGVGSRFWFALPLEVQEPLVEPPVPVLEDAPPTAAEATPESVTLRVLVAEDNAINQLVARRFLTALGFECTVVDNGQRAVDALTVPHAYDVVMMDWQMPELDGLEATRCVRDFEASHGLPRVPIIALTANALVGDREKCLAAGMDDFLSKPFRLQELSEKLTRWSAVQSTTLQFAPAACARLPDQ